MAPIIQTSLNQRKLDAPANLITIGRSPTNDIIVYNSMVSKSHCHLYFSDTITNCYLVDTGSINGTFIDNSKIKPNREYRLTDSDEISLGPDTKAIYLSTRTFHTTLTESIPFFTDL
ncbi:MAG: FHA domain-containing protein [Deltaproteobacteria bacterium]|nr:MAG: FHA domain-containing protein [Deltaproteobacteria bacterium]